MDYKKLLEYCVTEEQTKVIKGMSQGVKQADLARELGKTDRQVRVIRDTVKAIAASHGYAPGHFDQGTAPGFNMGKVTVQRGQDGEIERTWERQLPDDAARQEAIEATIAAMKEEIPPARKIAAPKKQTKNNLLNFYTLTDFHLGMLAWDEETGANWDLNIAENMMVDAFAYLIDNTPDAEVGFFNEMGDFEHYDSHIAVTPTNSHILDADGRPTKMIRASIRVQRRVIEMMARKYKKVIVLNAEGNHNIISSVWKREAFAELYRNNPRVEVITDVLPYYAYQWGKNMLGIHHGHLKRMAGLTDVFVSNYREMYGATELLHIHTGHQHHRELKETATAITEMHPTLAAPDAYSARGGWNSQRAMQTITYHKDFFEVGRVMVRPNML